MDKEANNFMNAQIKPLNGTLRGLEGSAAAGKIFKKSNRRVDK